MNNIISAVPTSGLRFVIRHLMVPGSIPPIFKEARVLQQLFTIQERDPEKGINFTSEWREVPLVEGEAASAT